MMSTIAAVVTSLTIGDWVLLSAGILLVLYVIGTWNYDYFRKRGIASTKPKVPFVGDLASALIGRVAIHDILRQIYERGNGHNVIGMFEFNKPVFMIRDPELLKTIAVKDFDNFLNHRSFGSEKIEPIFNKNLLNLKDQPWRDMRATLSPAFTTSKIKAMLPLISQCAEQLTHYLQEKYNNSKEATTKSPLEIDMDIFTRLTNDVIATTAFGVSCDSLKEPNNEFYAMGKTLTNITVLRGILIFVTLACPKFMEFIGIRVLDSKAVDFFDKLVHATIRERLKKGIYRPDMLQLLIQAREGKLKAEDKDSAETEKVGAKGINLTDEEISAQAIIFFLGGFETVSIAMCLTSYLLSHHIDVQKRLQAEIDLCMEETGGKLTYETVQSMKFLDAVVNETLRMYPPQPATDRVCGEDTTLAAGTTKPVAVSKGDLIMIPTIGLHHDPKFWEDPDKFDPERFSEENKHKIKPFTYMPFGTGPRFCIGQRFALIEVKMALVHLLMNFDLHPSAKTKHPLEYVLGATLRVRGGFWCCITPRKT